MRSNKKQLNIAEIQVFQAGRRVFDYLVDGEVKLGAIVRIPFGKRTVYGLVKSVLLSSKVDASKLKKVLEQLPEPFCLSQTQIELSHWMSSYYHDDLDVYQSMMLPKWIKQGKTQPLMPQHKYILCAQDNVKLSPRQKACIDWIQSTECEQIAHEALIAQGFGEPTIKSLLSSGWLSTISAGTLPFVLSDAQKLAVEKVLQHDHCTVLHGVTASGKTYVYLGLIESILEKGGQVLVLVPEIGLTPQITAKMRQHLDAPSIYWHSQLSDGQKSGVWEGVFNHDIGVVIGTRSAIFLPFKNLQLIIVDEEHDMSFYQQNRPYFSARDLAVLMAKLQNIRVVLGTATPSLETFNNVADGRYQYIELPKSYQGHTVDWHIVDARKQKLSQGIAPQILAQVKATLDQGHQVLFFLNRRGYAPLTLCHGCGWVYVCDQCDVKLTYSMSKKAYRCHLCQKNYPMVENCPSCGSDAVVQVGQGTEKLSEILKKTFPSTDVIRVDADSTSTPAQWAKVRQKILSAEGLIIVGTQMLAKGHDFPRLTQVVVLDADYALHATDFRSIERWGQRLKQVAGRCGRQLQAGHIWVQTHLPGHPAFEKLQKGSYDEFASYLLNMRCAAQWPPRYFLAKIKVVEKSVALLDKTLDKLLGYDLGVEMIGPIYPYIQKRQNQYHGYVLLKSNKRELLGRACRHMSDRAYLVEMDPQDLEA